jgi:hypothetical protein
MDFSIQYWFEIAAGGAAVGFLIWIAVLSIRLKSYKKLTTLLKGGNLEEHICKLEERCNSQQKAIDELNRQLKEVNVNTAAYPHHWHLVRYNAFDKTGSDLSFSLALLNDEAEGFVVTSIFGREDSRVYAKPLVKGKSAYTLSEEENRAITAAMNQKRR